MQTYRFRWRRSSLRGIALTAYLLLWNSILPAQSLPEVQPNETASVIAIRVTRFGPYPTSFTVPSGAVVLSITNTSRTQNDTYSLVIKGQEGKSSQQSLIDLHSSEMSHRDHKLIRALPGS